MNLQATELRIGDIIQWLHEESASIVEVDSEVIKNIELYNLNPNADQFARGIWYAPIDLSQEVLVQAGLSASGKKWKHSDGCFTLVENMVRPGVYYLDGYLNGITEVKYLHQLQNLYYFLSGGEELKLSPEKILHSINQS
jgi:hypothetical protein